KNVNRKIVAHFPDFPRIGQSRECAQKGLHRIGLKRWKTERIVDESIHFCVVPAKPIKRCARGFKSSVQHFHRVLPWRYRLSNASQAIKCARPGQCQAVDGMTVIEHKLLRRERAHAVSQQDVWPTSMLVLCDDS